MNIKDAKAIPLALVLETIGCQPVRDKKGEAVYLSPLRNERTPSFHVNAAKNAWYDFGEGGNTLDFVCTFLSSRQEADTIHDALRWLSNMTDSLLPPSSYVLPDPAAKDPSLNVRKVSRIRHKALIGYLAKRGIPLSFATVNLVELNIFNMESRKHFFALGMRNEEEGYELRSPFFKGCAGTKTITFIRGTEPKPGGIHLFEGMFDFLSALSFRKMKCLSEDVIILHSLSCLKQANPYIADYGYRAAFTWLDNDTAGAKATTTLAELFKAEVGLRHQPMNALYQPHKDVSAWHTHQSSLSPQAPA